MVIQHLSLSIPNILMLHSGGRFLDDIREIKIDKALTTLSSPSKRRDK